MKILKRYLSIILILVIGVGVTACGNSTPTSEVEEVLEGLRAGKREEVNVLVTDAINKSILGNSEELSKEVPSGMTEETQDLLNKVLGKMSYKINSENIENEKATVNVTLKGGNISKAFKGYLGDLLTLAYTSDVLSTTPKDEYFLLVNSIFYEKLKAIEYEDRSGDINLTKNGEKWVVENDAAFFELLLGVTGDNVAGNGN
ncbi:MAG: hypothetical protein E6344_10555 [Clostridium sp.]|uniref:hypothetical protein n=1 Tax=Clostridium culturomicium TaxID=1499683 RepID=UPI002907810A|nr:hypothetical protein [Clostridium sp.]MDU7084124.1 hypothetical protein [Clostridium sp.]